MWRKRNAEEFHEPSWFRAKAFNRQNTDLADRSHSSFVVIVFGTLHRKLVNYKYLEIMARKTFFSFHYGNDVARANQVRNSWVTNDSAGFVDKADFEKVEKEGDAAIKRWIKAQLSGTSVTVVLIGSQTSERDYVKFELQESYAKGNGMLGIYIHQCKNLAGLTSSKGSNMFGEIGRDSGGKAVYFSSAYKCYDWVDDNGYSNLSSWIEAAAKQAGK